MEARLDYAAIAPEFMKAMNGLERYVQNSSIEAPLRDIVKLRASQINRRASASFIQFDIRPPGTRFTVTVNGSSSSGELDME